jgi:hypothetical protein
MKIGTVLYAVVGCAAIIASIGVPWLIHRSGSTAVAGWQSLVSPGPISAAHTFIADQCETCHTPHASIDAQKCVACHATTSFQDKASTRFHAQVKNCGNCHFEHQGENAPIKMDHAALLKRDLWLVQPVSLTSTQHQSIRNYLSSETHTRDHHVASSLQCVACHSVSDPHAKLFGEECSSCHALDTWNVSGFRHPTMASTVCAECHRPPPSHGMMHFSMVSQRVAGKNARVEQCYACHATDSWNNIRDKGFYDHH